MRGVFGGTRWLAWVLLAAAGTVVFASTQHWATILGHREDGFARDGDITVWLGLLIAAGAVRVATSRPRISSYAAVAALSIAIVVIAVADEWTVGQIPRDAGLSPDTVSIGAGLTATVWAGVTCLLLSVIGLVLTSRRDDHPRVQVPALHP